ncbi:MAG: EAL domain-containing protein [Erythrobacter sp.]|nr:MAG: EAL domain-containing protein [Erythrobacter sp.]
MDSPVRDVPHEQDTSLRSRAEKRSNAIAEYDILDSGPELEFDSIVMLVAQIFGTQSAAISFVDTDRQWFKARCGIKPSETPISASFCAHTIEVDDILVIKDARADPRFATNPLVTTEPFVRFYAGVRIFSSDRIPIAALCVFDPQARPEGLTNLERRTLKVLASQVEVLLEMRRLVMERNGQVIAQSALSKRLRHVAEHDELTGLPNRGLFQKRLADAIRKADQDESRVALMMVDVDHFKQINDSLGHDVGDALLRSFARRLRSTVRKSDTVARLGGDEFGILLGEFSREEEVTEIVQSLINRLHEPITHRGRLVECRASIGIAIYPDHSDTAEGLTKCSDLALGEAKQSRGCAETFRRDMTEEFELETQKLSVARRALAEENVIAHYQPKIDLNSGTLVGFEALARCRSSERTPMLPESFLPAFENRELAVEISRQMVARVLDDVCGWVSRGIKFGHVAINTGAADFLSDDFAESLLAQIERRGLNPSVIEVEITEGVFLGRGSHHVARALSLLSQAGVRIALDDFGTGYASLTHLREFRVDVLKVDRTFVAGIGKNPDDTAIVRALIGLGNSLGIETVGEGIETNEQAAFMRTHGCDVGQGYLFSPAEPRARVPLLVSQFAKRAAA